MKIAGFLQNYNGAENGDLENVLTSMSLITDIIYVYDDCSEEPVRDIYEKFGCVVIYGRSNEFKKEQFHKQDLLNALLSDHPDTDWIVWYDSDAILGSYFEDRKNTVSLLESADRSGNVQIYLHNLNLWKNPLFYRVDNSYNDLWHCVFWKNTGQLRYYPEVGLHQKQYPLPFPPKEGERMKIPAQKLTINDGKLLHFGFMSEDRIAQKYYRYRENGQRGWALDRLIDERTLKCEKAESSWYPKFYKKKMGNENVFFFMPKENDEMIRTLPFFDSYKEYLLSDYRRGKIGDDVTYKREI